MPLRPYQEKLKRDAYAAWDSGAQNVGAVAATGAGKTVIFSDMLAEADGHRIASAHRQELVGQMSLTLAKHGIRHSVLAPDAVRRFIVSRHIEETGRSYLDPSAKVHCAGVDTLADMPPQPWERQVTLQVLDEAHHVLRENKWGKAAARFPNARGFLPSATMQRADGKGLGRHAAGIIDTLVFAPGMRDIINMGYLLDYRIILAESDIRLTDSDISATTGDFNLATLRKKHRENPQIVGDVVEQYLKHAAGLLGATFAVDAEEAANMAAAYRARGVPAEVVTYKTPNTVRVEILKRFRRREILQLVNVDLFGEGFDLPALDVVSMARHTASYPLYAQQYGRPLRLDLPREWARNWDSFTDAQRLGMIAASKKPRGIIIDHVGNIMRHNGPPDAVWQAERWTLDGRDKRQRAPTGAEPLRTCLKETCLQPYSRVLKKCPRCGEDAPAPTSRSAPEFVDGDLSELSPEAMARLRGEVVSNIGDAPPYHPDPLIAASLRKRHAEKQIAVHKLRNAMSWWAGLQQAQGRSDSESYKLFYFRFGVDVMTAQTYSRAQAEDLYQRLHAELAKAGVNADLDAGILLQH